MAEVFPKKVSFAQNNFEFSGTACECKVGTTFTSEGDERNIFYLYPKDETIYYAYVAGTGLVSSKHESFSQSREVLPGLLEIKTNNSKSVKAFIEKHGFFLPLDLNGHIHIEAQPLFEMINRLKATVFLMMAIAEAKADYEKILALTLYLLLSPQISIKLPDGHEPFLTCQHDMGRVWSGKYQPNRKIEDLKPNNDWEFVALRQDESVDIKLSAEDINSLKQQQDQSLDSGSYIPDSIRSRNIWFDMNEYHYALDYLAEHPSSMRAKATVRFFDAKNVETHCRLTVDFLYNFCKDVGEIETWSYDGKLTFADNKQSISQIFRKKLDEQLREGLLKIAKYTLKTEIEYNLRIGVIPSYDTEAMAPTWRIDYLLSGLYLSVFYMQPNIALYRTCQNPNCGQYFLVHTTAYKKKYCDDTCSNAMQQRKYRLRKKAQQIKATEEEEK